MNLSVLHSLIHSVSQSFRIVNGVFANSPEFLNLMIRNTGSNPDSSFFSLEVRFISGSRVDLNPDL